MWITDIDHLQIAAPKGCEPEARRFFGDLLGLQVSRSLSTQQQRRIRRSPLVTLTRFSNYWSNKGFVASGTKNWPASAVSTLMIRGEIDWSSRKHPFRSVDRHRVEHVPAPVEGEVGFVALYDVLNRELHPKS